MTDEEKLAKRRLDEEHARQLREVDVNAVMRTASGRRFVWDLLERIAGLGTRCHVPDSDSTTAFNDGMREVGRILLRELNVFAPRQVRAMVMEGFDERLAGLEDPPKHETNQE